MNWKELVNVRITDDGVLSVEFGPVVLIALGVGLLLLVFLLIISRRGLPRRWEAIEANVRLGGIGTVKLKPNLEDVQVAHKAWVELATRKAGLPFDRENDVISEVYDSWYELFREMRVLAKQFPCQKLRVKQDGLTVVDLLVKALNLGLRPHLTRWQARFRRWYEKALEDHPGESPQEVQRLFPEYHELTADLKRVSADLIEYMGVLKRVVAGGQEST